MNWHVPVPVWDAQRAKRSLERRVRFGLFVWYGFCRSGGSYFLTTYPSVKTTPMDDLDLGSTIRGFAAGQKVFRRYTLKKILGRGGMGVVWLAKDDKLDRQVALKFLPEVMMGDKLALSDLKRETRRSLELTHSHIVRIYDFVEDARTAAIAMEYS